MKINNLHINEFGTIVSSLVETFNFSVFILDNDKCFLYMSPVLLKEIGYDTITGVSFLDLVYEEDREIAKNLLTHDVHKTYKIRIISKNNSIINCVVNCVSLHTYNEYAFIGLINFSEAVDSVTEDILLKLSSAVEHSPISIAITDDKGILEYVNPGFEKMTCYHSSEIMGHKLDVLRAEDEVTSYEEMCKTIKSGKIWIGEIHSKKKTGESYWESASVSPITNRRGKISHFLRIAEDITEKKMLMDTLLSSYDFIQNVMDNTSTIFVIDSDGNFILVNKVFSELTGYATSKIAGQNISLLFDDKTLEDFQKEFSKVVDKHEKVIKFETRLVKKNKESCIVSLNMSPLFKKDTIDYIVGTMEDITERVKAAAELKKFSRAIEQSPVTVVITDTQGKIEYVNPKFTSLTGYSYEEALGQNPNILKSGEQEQNFYKGMWEQIASGQEWRGEFHNLKKNGEIYWENAVISPIRDQDGVITHFIAVKEDITEKKKAQDALKISEETLRKKNESMERDLEYAQIVITRLLPQELPQFPSLNIYYKYMPLEAIGGDFFSFTNYDDDGFGFFLADVSGHGVSAALFLSLLKFTTERISGKYGKQPLLFIQELNNELAQNMYSFFLTAIYCYFKKTADGIELKFAKGGHPPPAIYTHEKNSTEYIKSKGKIIGMFPEIEFEEVTVQLNKGDRIFIYTDGLNETINNNNELLDFEGLLKIIHENNYKSIEQALDNIIDSVNQYREAAPVEDDIVLVGFEVQ